MGHRYKGKGHFRYARRGKSGFSEKLVKQIVICMVIVLAVIVAKKMDTAITNKTMDVFESCITKDYEVSELAYTAQETVSRALGLSVKMGETIEASKSVMAFVAPVESEEAISVFGSVQGWSGQEEAGFERGMKFDASQKELQVFSSAGGTVEEVNTSATYGQYIKIAHGSGVYTIYGGCTSIYVKPLEKVKKGQLIASVAAGDGNYLSFELWIDGEVVDPADYINF